MAWVTGSESPASHRLKASYPDPAHVWMPSLGVWAMVPTRSGSSDSDPEAPSSRRSRQGDNHAGSASKDLSPSFSSEKNGLRPQQGGGIIPILVAENEQPQRPASFSASDDESYTCAICLGVLKSRQKAVLKWCLHQYCLECIEQWSQVQRLCPLCKATFVGWFCNISGDDQFEDVDLSLLRKPSSAEVAHDASSFPAWAQNSERPHRDRWWSRRALRPPPRREVQEARAPTPYFLRLQRGLLAAEQELSRNLHPPIGSDMERGRCPSAHNEGVAMHTPGPSRRQSRQPESQSATRSELANERALMWRRSIYQRGLKARPPPPPRQAAPPPLRAAADKISRMEQRLEPWIRRELKALLPHDSDPTLLVRLTLGLWGARMRQPSQPTASVRARVSSGASNFQETQASDVGVAVMDATAVKELVPFLGDFAAAYWHELRCFAESSFTMQAYDLGVHYAPGNLSADDLSSLKVAAESSQPRHIRTEQREHSRSKSRTTPRGGAGGAAAGGSGGEGGEGFPFGACDVEGGSHSSGDRHRMSGSRWQVSRCPGKSCEPQARPSRTLEPCRGDWSRQAAREARESSRLRESVSQVSVARSSEKMRYEERDRVHCPGKRARSEERPPTAPQDVPMTPCGSKGRPRVGRVDGSESIELQKETRQTHSGAKKTATRTFAGSGGDVGLGFRSGSELKRLSVWDRLGTPRELSS